MTEEELLKKITAVVVEKLGVKPEDVTREASFVNDLGAASRDRVELVMALEDEVDLAILDEDAEKFIKVSDVLSYIQNKLNK